MIAHASGGAAVTSRILVKVSVGGSPNFEIGQPYFASGKQSKASAANGWRRRSRQAQFSVQRRQQMIVTVFRSRLNPGTQDEYGPISRQMSELVRDIPGYISHMGFVADDGERVTIVDSRLRKHCTHGAFIPNMVRQSGAPSRASSLSTSFGHAG
jgi:hypothetical protein